jgi:hypothetical protein
MVSPCNPVRDAVTLVLLVIGLALMAVTASAQLFEEERVTEYYKRNYTWPVTHYVPNTEGWKNLFEERFRQVEEIDDADRRYEGYLQTVHAAYLVPNFTEHGFGLARCPDDLTKALQKGIRDGLATARYEGAVEVIDAPEQPLFIDRPDLTKRVLEELKDYAEEWSGIELTPFRAYGFRLYQNQSQVRRVTRSEIYAKPFFHLCNRILSQLLFRRTIKSLAAYHACGQSANPHHQLYTAH